MAKTTALTITVSVSGDSLTPYTYAPTFSNSSAFGSGGPYNVALSAGNNTLTTPTQATTPPKFIVIIPASDSSNTKTIKGNAGDTGVANWTSQPVILPVASASAIIITSTGTETVSVAYF